MALPRRALLGAARETHFASLVVHCRSEQLAAARDAIAGLPGVEVPLGDDNTKLIALLELHRESELLERMSAIEAVPGVVAATLVFHQVETGEERA